MATMADLPQLIARADWPGAERVLRRAAQGPNPPAAVFYNLAKVLEAQGKHTQRGLWLERALAVDPGHALSWFDLGRLHTEAQPRAALRAFARAAALVPSDLESQRMVARLALRLGDWAALAGALAHLPQDGESRIAAYRLACETGQDARALRDALLADPAQRPAALAALGRVARGSLPLRLPPLPDQS